MRRSHHCFRLLHKMQRAPCKIFPSVIRFKDEYASDELSVGPATNTKCSYVQTHSPCCQAIGGLLHNDTFTCVVSPMPREMIGRESGFLSRYEFLSLAMFGNKYPALCAPSIAPSTPQKHPLPASGPLHVGRHSRPWDADGGGNIFSFCSAAKFNRH